MLPKLLMVPKLLRCIAPMESIVHLKTDLNPPESVQKGDFSKGTA